MKLQKIFAYTASIIMIGLFPYLAFANPPTFKELNSFVIPPSEINGFNVHELSGLAWDEDEKILYAISDRGILFHFRLAIENDEIKQVVPFYATRFIDEKGKEFKKHDTEGLLVLNGNNGKQGDSQLVVAFEGEPRLIKFTPQGQAISAITLPKELMDKSLLRASNRSLESVAYHPQYGFITAPELPLRNQPKDKHTLYSTQGYTWSYPVYPAPNSGITAMETLPDGNLLIMERAWSGFFSPLEVSIRYLNFQECNKGECAIHDLKAYTSMLVMDNYEGLTRWHDNRYLIVSDDGSHELQRTVLMLFSLE